MERGTDGEIDVRLLGDGDVEGAVEVLVRAFNEFNVGVRRPAVFSTFSQARSTLQMALTLDPSGAWVAVWNNRKIVGVAISYRLGDYVSIGPVAVHPSMQARGVGRRMMRSIMGANTDASCLMLAQDGTNPQSFALYRSLGFHVVGAIIGLSGTPALGAQDDGRTREASPDDVDAIVALDRDLTGIDRADELRMLMGFGRTMIRDDGYAMTVRLGDVRGLGPGAARTPASMRALIGMCLCDAPPGGVMVRVPGNGAAYDALTDVGLRPDGLGNLMAIGDVPDRPGAHLFPVFPEVL